MSKPQPKIKVINHYARDSWSTAASWKGAVLARFPGSSIGEDRTGMAQVAEFNGKLVGKFTYSSPNSASGKTKGLGWVEGDAGLDRAHDHAPRVRVFNHRTGDVQVNVFGWRNRRLELNKQMSVNPAGAKALANKIMGENGLHRVKIEDANTDQVLAVTGTSDARDARYMVQFGNSSTRYPMKEFTDAEIDAAAKRAGVWKSGGSYPSFTVYEAGEEIGGGGGSNSGSMDRVHDRAPRVRVFNHYTPATQDAKELTVSELRVLGKQLLVHDRSSSVRAWSRTEGYTRAQEAFIVEGWKQARMEAGLSENV